MGASDIVRTEFNASERGNAEYLNVAPAWHHGYPQPEDDFAYLSATYDLKEYCPGCGIGEKQVAPFRMKGEPKWGKNPHFAIELGVRRVLRTTLGLGRGISSARRRSYCRSRSSNLS